MNPHIDQQSWYIPFPGTCVANTQRRAPPLQLLKFKTAMKKMFLAKREVVIVTRIEERWNMRRLLGKPFNSPMGDAYPKNYLVRLELNRLRPWDRQFSGKRRELKIFQKRLHRAGSLEETRSR